MSDDNPTPKPTEDDADGNLYAVYDKTVLRFITGPHKTKAAATKAANPAKGHKTEARKV